MTKRVFDMNPFSFEDALAIINFEPAFHRVEQKLAELLRPEIEKMADAMHARGETLSPEIVLITSMLYGNDYPPIHVPLYVNPLTAALVAGQGREGPREVVVRLVSNPYVPKDTLYLLQPPIEFRSMPQKLFKKSVRMWWGW